MMRLDSCSFASRLGLVAASLFLVPALLSAQAPQTGNAPASAPSTAKTSTDDANRSVSYFHAGLAGMYEDDAMSDGRQDQVTHAIEEYKSALNADPASPQLNDELAELYFRGGRVREAESTARNLLKTSPNDVDAHKLLGRIYLRQLGENANGVSSSSPAGNVLDQAIAEFEKIVALDSKTVEDRMVLGQLYTVKHEPQKAEASFQGRPGYRAGLRRRGPQHGSPLRRERRHSARHQGY